MKIEEMTLALSKIPLLTSKETKIFFEENNNLCFELEGEIWQWNRKYWNHQDLVTLKDDMERNYP